MPFSELIGQDRALGALRAALARGALHHAYLFGGPEGVGKGTAARLLAQAANCESDRDRPCGECGPCGKIERGAHPDVLVVEDERTMARAGRWEPRGGRAPSRDIVVDQIRDLVYGRLALRRFEGRRRFLILDPADAMNPQAQNALLKTLEEPPDDTTLVLVASSPDALLPTVRSRCVRLAFVPLPDDVVAGRLAAAGRDPIEARLAVAVAGGSLGRALALDADALEARARAVSDAARLDPDDASTWLRFARDHGASRDSARDACEVLRVWLRDVLARQVAGKGAALALAQVAEETASAAGALAPGAVARRVEQVDRAVAALAQNAAPVLALERMLIGWFDGDLG